MKPQCESLVRVTKDHVLILSGPDDETCLAPKSRQSQIGHYAGRWAVASCLEEWSGGTCQPGDGRFGSRQGRIDERGGGPRRWRGAYGDGCGSAGARFLGDGAGAIRVGSSGSLAGSQDCAGETPRQDRSGTR